MPSGNLRVVKDWRETMQETRGLICPETITDAASLYSAIEYLDGISQAFGKSVGDADHRGRGGDGGPAKSASGSSSTAAAAARTRWGNYLAASKSPAFASLQHARWVLWTLSGGYNYLAAKREPQALQAKMMPAAQALAREYLDKVSASATDDAAPNKRFQGEPSADETVTAEGETSRNVGSPALPNKAIWNVDALLADEGFIQWLLSK
jgi:hypothetical protein